MTKHEKRSLQYRLARRFDTDPRRVMEIIREEIKKTPLTEEAPKGERIPVSVSVKAEIEKKCDRINSIASVLRYPQHREIQELLCGILASIGEESDDNR